MRDLVSFQAAAACLSHATATTAAREDENGADFRVAVDRPLMLVLFLGNVSQDNWFTALRDSGYQAHFAVLVERHVNAEKRAVCFFDQILPRLAVLVSVAIGVVGSAPRLAQQARDVLPCGTAYLDL